AAPFVLGPRTGLAEQPNQGIRAQLQPRPVAVLDDGEAALWAGPQLLFSEKFLTRPGGKPQTCRRDDEDLALNFFQIGKESGFAILPILLESDPDYGKQNDCRRRCE